MVSTKAHKWDGVEEAQETEDSVWSRGRHKEVSGWQCGQESLGKSAGCLYLTGTN